MSMQLFVQILVVTATAARYGKGRVLDTALGHREDVWRSAWFRAHLSGILTWAVDPPAPEKRRAVRR